MTPRMLFRSAVIVAALSVGSLALAGDAKGPPDLTGEWRFDVRHSDLPQRSGDGGSGRPRGGPGQDGMRGGWGGRGGGGMRGAGGRRGGGGDVGGGPDAPGGEVGPAGRPARLPDLLHITQTASLVSFEDSTGAVIQEIATVPAAADTFARAPGAVHIPGQWDTDKLVIERTGPRDSKITETITLENQGKTLVIETRRPAMGQMPSREFKRVYARVFEE